MGPLVLSGISALFWRGLSFKNRGHWGSRYIYIYKGSVFLIGILIVKWKWESP